MTTRITKRGREKIAAMLEPEEPFQFGDVLRLSDVYIEEVPTCFKEMRVMFIAATAGIVIRADPRGSNATIGDIHGEVRRPIFQKTDE